MTLPETDPPGEPPEARLPKDPAWFREVGPRSGTGFRVEPRSSIPARTVLAPRAGLAPRTALSPLTPGEPRRAAPGRPDPATGEEPPAG
ncbi:MAG: hypothetical protein QOD86_3055 [Miltoncostaeaceae bacterium]|nr:hypothetical protein [Miltoncostaeaceae bacterium]